jgi:hypothetical protein
VFPSQEKPLEEKEYPDEADLGEDADECEALVRACPACGEPIFEDAPQCPHCREWVVQPGRLWRQSRKWYVRAGLYLTKTFLINWVFWVILAALAAAATILGLMK